MSTYVSKRYHFDPTSQLKMVDIARDNDTCFWKLHYKAASPARDLTLYLSPDGQYLTTTLFDMQVDPAIEENLRIEKTAKLLLAGSPPAIGLLNAPVTLVEFSDFECPYCKRLTEIIAELTPEDRSDIRIVFREFPLPMHPWAKDAAEIAGCAALQSDAAFWELHDYLFENQKTITVDNLRDSATTFAVTKAGLDKAQFQNCLDRKLSAGGVAQDMDLGKANAVRATPTIFVNGTRYEGMKDAAALHAIIVQINKSRQAEFTAAAKPATSKD